MTPKAIEAAKNRNWNALVAEYRAQFEERAKSRVREWAHGEIVSEILRDLERNADATNMPRVERPEPPAGWRHVYPPRPNPWAFYQEIQEAAQRVWG